MQNIRRTLIALCNEGEGYSLHIDSSDEEVFARIRATNFPHVPILTADGYRDLVGSGTSVGAALNDLEWLCSARPHLDALEEMGL